jgi:galactose mutarotase-like enzyme
MVTGCYEWTYAKMLPIFQISNRLSNGSYVVQGSATFVTEPFK